MQPGARNNANYQSQLFMSTHVKEIFHVLMADDDEEDRMLMKLALRRAARLQLAGEAENGNEVVSYLKGQGQYSNRQAFPVPDLLLLDLKMPGKDGFEVLQ